MVSVNRDSVVSLDGVGVGMASVCLDVVGVEIVSSSPESGNGVGSLDSVGNKSGWRR